MDFKKLAAKTTQNRRKRAEEQAALEEIAREDRLDETGREHPPPAHGSDWRRQMGELYGSPQKHSDGWGICIVPTKQQARQIAQRHNDALNSNELAKDYLKDEIAVSIDKTGRERRMTISRTLDNRYDLDGNELVICETRPRDREGT